MQFDSHINVIRQSTNTIPCHCIY